MIEPEMTVLDLTGALSCWKRDARSVSELVQLRVLAFFGLRSSAAVAPNRMLAAIACALAPTGRPMVIDDSPEAITAFLRPRPGANTAAPELRELLRRFPDSERGRLASAAPAAAA
ncbi:hypothetical protein ACGFZJ_09645 [Streptomyces sp. NPDC048253]|uniref:hypothetical protein n=1 Tax=Streptomyces sp. NPDC048253 TaxID=3365524 RepID=UPI00371FB2E4